MRARYKLMYMKSGEKTYIRSLKACMAGTTEEATNYWCDRGIEKRGKASFG